MYDNKILDKIFYKSSFYRIFYKVKKEIQAT